MENYKDNFIENKEEINWDELRKKMEADEEEEINGLIDQIDDCNCSACKHWSNCAGNAIGIPSSFEGIELPNVNTDDYDFHDEHGLIDPELGLDDQDILIDKDDEDETAEANDVTEKDISNLAWNKNTPIMSENLLNISPQNMFYPKDESDLNGYLNPIDIKCKHFDEESMGISEVYIYPINDFQRVCLCKFCNANLASKMFEQLALETFIVKS